MLKVATCLAEQHDWRLVVAAAAVSLLGSLLAFGLFERTRGLETEKRRELMFAAGAAAGLSVWATHFIGMLAYRGAMPIEYNALWTVVSAIIAVAAALKAFNLASDGRRAVAGVTMGLGVAAMHFMGIVAIEAPARIHFDLSLAVFAIVLGLAAATVAMSTTTLPSRIGRILGGTLGLFLATCVLHFVAMAALTLKPDPGVSFAAHAYATPMLIVEVLTALIGISWVGARVLARDMRRAADIAALAACRT